MAVRHGYGKVVTDGLVFAYDTGDIVNSFKGKPGTNILKFINQQYSDTDETYFKLTNGIHDVYIPTLGTRTVKYVDIWNDYNNGSGRCCLSLFGYGTGITAVQPSTTYMYQVVYKTDTGYSHPNYMYRYEYDASGTKLIEGGLHSTSRRTALGDGWYHGWGSFTTQATTSYINTYLFHYEYATQNKVQVAAVSLTEGTEIIPPKQFIGFEQTRSATEGLLDLTGNSSVDLTNASFDTDAMLDFDGSGDYLNLGDSTNWDFGGNGTLEMVLRPEGSTGNNRLWCIDNNPSNLDAYLDGSGYNVFMHGGIVGTTTSLTQNQWNHLSVVYNNGTIQIYVNGIAGVMTGTTTGYNITNNSGNNSNLYIGCYRNLAYNFNGGIAIFKVHNRALTATEVAQNFGHYKTRFGI